jgi:hypothetical protein
MQPPGFFDLNFDIFVYFRINFACEDGVECHGVECVEKPEGVELFMS